MLKPALLKFVHWVSRIGVSKCPDPRRAKRIVLSNQIAFSVAFLCLPYFVIYQIIGMPVYSWLSLGNAAAYLLIPCMNAMGRFVLSRLLFVIIASIVIAASALGLGKGAGIHIFFLPLGWISLVLFEWEERKSITFGIVFSSLMLLAFEAFGPERGLGLPHSPDTIRLIHFCVLTTILISQIMVVLYFFQANRRAEAALTKAGEASESADKAKSQFLANMSHEIRTPLNGILGMSSLLLKAELRGDQKDLVQAIQSSGLDLMTIISEILDLSKIEAGKMRLEKIPFDPREAVEAILRPFKHEARRKALDFDAEIPEKLPARLIGDAVRLKQVLNNLLGNALKFTQSGGVTLKIRMEGVASGGLRLHFEVRDTGIGIEDASQGRIFQSFAQAEETSSRRFGGTGLGLFISKQIVDMMGGTIGFSSRSGEGSMFHFEIPFGIPAAEAETPSEVPEASAASAPDARLLIVEDHPLNRKVLAGFLAQFACKVDAVGGGQEALKVFGTQAYDLVFMDCHMPGMDGFECTRALRALDPLAPLNQNGKRPIIIGVTADAMLGTRERCLESGMDDVLTKPILSKELNRMLSRWLGITIGLPSSDGETAPQTYHQPSPKSQKSEWVDVGHLREMDEWAKTYDPLFWDRAVDQFRDSAHRLIGEIRSARLEGRLHEAEEAAHTLKGLCLMMGLSRMGETCKSLEEGGEDGEDVDWSAQVASLETLIEPSLTEMKKRVGGEDR
jgi:signal transduction histidine kinase/DNA-binding NarL/FixJ family response regulator